MEAPEGMPQETPESSITDTENAVVFQNVSLSYHKDSDTALCDISFAAKRGATVGIIGGTGSGKSSLINLIPRFYDVTEGRVFVDGTDVRAYQNTEELRAKIGIVPQKAELFAGSVRENLLWGRGDARDEELFSALESAQAADFVKEKEGGLDFMIEQGGRNLSGGQRQRMTIARALVRKPEILILDDSASALDLATDAALRKSLASLPYHPTTFIVSQRTASIRHADLIVVMEEGEAVGIGKHDELMQSCEVYREIHESQFKDEEVTA
jgi:ABC-type multidrug transport system fused ATPase/permease subunit